MYCPKCGKLNDPAARFCTSCGEPLPVLVAGVPTMTLVTLEKPDQPELAVPAQSPSPDFYASVWERAAAVLIDGVIILVGAFIIILMANVVSGGGNQEVMFGLGMILAFFGSAAYYAGMESSSKQATFGKMAMGIKVTDLQGRRIGFWQAFGRYAGQILSSVLINIGYLIAAFTRRRQTLHDIMASCLVVKKKTTEADLTAHPTAPKMEAWSTVLWVIGWLVIVLLTMMPS